MNHYVYLLHNTEEDKYYIGVRSCKCKISEDSYMGSSLSMTAEDISKCVKIILKRCPTRKEAISYEIELHSKFDVAVNPLFYNKAKQTSTGFDQTGVTRKQSSIDKQSKTNKDKYKKGLIKLPTFKGKFGKDHNLSKGFFLRFPGGKVVYYESGLEMKRLIGADNTAIPMARKQCAKYGLSSYTFSRGKLKRCTYLPHFELV